MTVRPWTVRMKHIFLILVAVLLVSGCTKNGANSEPAKPNILFIIADDLRPDLGAYGDNLAVTPHLDKLAGESLVFNRAYCQKAVCWPSRNSFFSGLMPASLGKKTFHLGEAKAEAVVAGWCDIR